MNSSPKRILPWLLFIFCALALTMSGCNRSSRDQKALRAELREALREHSYGKAAELARRVLKLNPQDNGTWDRLVRAQFGLRDPAGVRQALEDWRRTVSKPSPKLEEYAGDFAVEQHDPAGAIQAWTKVLAVEPKNTRVLEKVARV